MEEHHLDRFGEDFFTSERQQRGEAVYTDIFRHIHLILRGVQVA